MTIFFDIETAGACESRVRFVTREFKKPGPWPEFDPTVIKCGNIGGPDSDKGKAKIADAKSKYEQDAQKAADEGVAAEAAYWAKKVSEAALHPETGRVVCVGVLSATKNAVLIIGERDPDEATILREWWDCYRKMRAQRRKIVGVNILAFDLPFLITRSWILDVSVPETACERKGKWINFDPLFVDLRESWLMGRKWSDCESSLDHMAKSLGIGSKTDGLAGECSGKTFAQLWESGDAGQRAAARAYLANDLLLPQLIAAKMGIV